MGERVGGGRWESEQTENMVPPELDAQKVAGFKISDTQMRLMQTLFDLEEKQQWNGLVAMAGGADLCVCRAYCLRACVRDKCVYVCVQR